MFRCYFSDGYKWSDLNVANKQFGYLKACSDGKGVIVSAVDVAT